MALLKTEAEKLSNDDLKAGVIEEIIDQEDLFALLPFDKTQGKAYVYNRENTISEGQFLDPNETVPEGAADFEQVTTNLKILAGDVDVDKFLDTTMADTNGQRAIQIAQKAKGLARKFRRTLAQGDSAVNAKEFDGIGKLVHNDQILNDGESNSLTLSQLDELLDAVPNGADVIMMRPGTRRAFINQLRTQAGGTDSSMLQLENFGRPVLTHNGTPIIENEFLPADEGSGNDTCSVYAMRLNIADGLHGIYGGDGAGIAVEDLGTVQDKDANRMRLKWYTGTALKSTQSLARLAGVTNT